MKKFKANGLIRRKRFFANSVDAFIPEVWANESLAILEENMVMAPLVHQDFKDEVAQYGQTIHTRRPGEFSAKRKWTDDDVTVQNVTATNVEVKLNQCIHVSFLLKDNELTLSFKDLVSTYIAPAMLAQARFVDRAIYGMYPAFLANSTGTLGSLSGQAAKDGIIDTREIMNTNKAYTQGRNFVITSKTEANLLKPEFFTSAEKVGDGGTALRNASLGHKLGFDFFMTQNAASVIGSGAFTTSAGAINLTAGYAKGSTSAMVVDGITGIIATGTWLSIGGVPYQVTAHSETMGNTTGITLDRALLYGVANDAVITFYTPGAVNLVAGYAADWYKPIAFDGFTGSLPKVGQVVSFHTDVTNRYVIVDVDATTMTLDRPLVAALVNDQTVNIGPAGEYNMAFHRNAMTLVTRPLSQQGPQLGNARSAVVNYNGYSMRVVMTYEGRGQGLLITLDMLFGTKVLDTNLGALLFA